MRILRAASYAIVPWRNGGGTTREVLLHRDPNRPGEFLWRISIATVDRSGPFSRFDGVDRSIALLSGGGMVLHSPDSSTKLTANTAPFSFCGETDITCELLDGTTTDLNVMTCRSAFRHTMRRDALLGWHTIEARAEQTIVVANGVVGFSEIDNDTLRPHDAIVGILAETTLDLYAEQATEVFVAELETTY